MSTFHNFKPKPIAERSEEGEMIRRLIQRITDFRRELLITALRRDVVQLYDKGEFAAARAAFDRLFEECAARSSAQIERMKDAEEYCA